jgi:hypothetical protein
VSPTTGIPFPCFAVICVDEAGRCEAPQALRAVIITSSSSVRGTSCETNCQQGWDVLSAVVRGHEGHVVVLNDPDVAEVSTVLTASCRPTVVILDSCACRCKGWSSSKPRDQDVVFPLLYSRVSLAVPAGRSHRCACASHTILRALADTDSHNVLAMIGVGCSAHMVIPQVLGSLRVPFGLMPTPQPAINAGATTVSLRQALFVSTSTFDIEVWHIRSIWTTYLFSLRVGFYSWLDS